MNHPSGFESARKRAECDRLKFKDGNSVMQSSGMPLRALCFEYMTHLLV